MVLRNDTLKHIDISYNRYNKAEVEIIAEALKANHTVLGMHVEGNAASYDPKGYLIAQDSISAPVIMSHRAKPSVKNCWICEGWKAIKVTWSPSEVGWSGKFLEKFSMRAKRMEPVYLHMETDGYDPCYMPKNSDGSLSRISNWHAMTVAEQQKTLKLIGRRNRKRRQKLGQI